MAKKLSLAGKELVGFAKVIVASAEYEAERGREAVLCRNIGLECTLDALRGDECIGALKGLRQAGILNDGRHIAPNIEMCHQNGWHVSVFEDGSVGAIYDLEGNDL